MFPLFAKKDPQAEVVKANQDWLASLGSNPGERANAIDAMFQQGSKTIRAAQFEKWPAQAPDGNDGYIAFTVSRGLSEMHPDERAALHCAEHLNNLMNGQLELYRRWRVALVWGDGKGRTVGSVQYEGLSAANPIGDYVIRMGLNAAQVARAIPAHIIEVKDDPNAPEGIRRIFQALFESMGRATAAGPAPAPPAAAPPKPQPAAAAPKIARPAAGPNPFAAPGAPRNAARAGPLAPIMGGAAGPGFLTPDGVPQSAFRTQGPYPIYLGTLPQDGSWLSYSGGGALLTVAPPGSGKTQCHVIPNLLQWPAPAVVLDVKGELYTATSRWRAENVGPVFRFAPTDPRRSHHYNPLALVSDERDQVWQESRFLADMLIVPSGEKDRFWDESAKALVAAAIAYIVHSSPPDDRTMSKLLDIVHGGAPFKEMIEGLTAAERIPPMVRAGTSLGEMDEKTRANVLSTVQTSFHAWEDAPVTAVTDRCDWSPTDLRAGSGGHPTVYICLRPREVEAYISILRVLIAQHIRMLTAELPAEGARGQILPVLFMLDELPRLKEMPPVAEAIEIGASYGLRVWMFAQSLGQLQKAYPNADGMISSCAVRVYFNPTGADGLAEKLSKELGNVANPADGTQLPLVPAHELAGPKWEKMQLALALATRPARIQKEFAHENDALKTRIGSL
jgi:type IV secretion system protein VirD4